MTDRKFPVKRERQMPSESHATEAQKHSKVARAATDEAHARSSSKK
jgi:hypothetical protein